MLGVRRTGADPLNDKDEIAFVRSKLTMKYRLIFNLQMAFGLRVCDVVRITQQEAKNALYLGKLEYQEKKTSKYRSVKLEPKMKTVLKSALDRAKRLDYTVYLFESDSTNAIRGRHITTRAVSHAMEDIRDRWLGRFGEDKVISTHTARKTFATYLFKQTNDLAIVAAAIGHSDPQVTKRYLGTSKAEVAAAMASLDNLL